MPFHVTPELGQFGESLPVRFAVEGVGARAATRARPERDVDRLAITSRLLDPSPEVVEHAGEVIDRLEHGRLGRAGESGRCGKRVPSVTLGRDPGSGQLTVATDPNRARAPAWG